MSLLSHALGTTADEDVIVLPFVSKGATWMDDDVDYNVNVSDGYDGVEMSSSIDGDGSGTTTQDKGDDDNDDDVDDDDNNDNNNNEEGKEGEDEEDDVEDDDDDNLFLVLLPFATSEYADVYVDTLVFSYEGGDSTRLVRDGELTATTTSGCDGRPRGKSATGRPLWQGRGGGVRRQQQSTSNGSVKGGQGLVRELRGSTTTRPRRGC